MEFWILVSNEIKQNIINIWFGLIYQNENLDGSWKNSLLKIFETNKNM